MTNVGSAAQGGSEARLRRSSSGSPHSAKESRAASVREASDTQRQRKKKRRFDEEEAERVRRADPAIIKNKARSSNVRAKKRQLRQQNRREKKKERKRKEARGEIVEKETPRTIESMRRPDDSVVKEGDAEVAEAEAADEFASIFKGERIPKLMITSSKRPSAKFYDFLKEIVIIFPNAFYYKPPPKVQFTERRATLDDAFSNALAAQRQLASVKTVCKAAIEMKFTAVLLFSERNGKPHGVYICHLPDLRVQSAPPKCDFASEGPTSFFRMTGVTLAQDLVGGGATSTHLPELLLNNFDTMLGRRVARILASLFPVTPQFTGRRVITFHNQRDFIFFRHHRYIFREKKRKRPPLEVEADRQEGKEDADSKIDPRIGTALQEVGPRFTLKLMWVHSGLFNTKKGLYEFVWRPDLKVDRKRMLI